MNTFVWFENAGGYFMHNITLIIVAGQRHGNLVSWYAFLKYLQQ